MASAAAHGASASRPTISTCRVTAAGEQTMPNYGAASAQAVLMLQKVNKDIQLVGNYDAELDQEFSSIGPGDEIGLQNYRLPLQMETGGVASYYQPDGGNYPQGTGPQYDQKIIAPQPIILAFAATELARRIAKAGKDVTVENYVAKMIANAKKKAAHVRNAYLQGSNDGVLATVDATDTGAGTSIILQTASFGGRLINRGDQVILSAPNYTFRSATPANVIDVYKNSIGKPDTMIVDARPAGTVAGDLVMAVGLTSGAPVAINGLQYLVSPSTAGDSGGIVRTNSYVQSPAWNANGAFLTLGGILAFLARMEQALGTERFNSERTKNFWYGHQAQWLTGQVLGFGKTVYMSQDGKTPTVDIAPNAFAKRTLAGMPFRSGSMAAIDKLYWLDKGTLKRVRYPDSEKFLPGPLEGMFWPRQSGGLWNSESDVLYQDSVQYAVNNDWANGVMYGLGLQAVLSN
jgi:hypothetical protein